MARLVSEEGELRLYHCTDNAKVYRGEVPQYVVFEDPQAEALEHLLKNGNEWFPICALPGLAVDDAVALATVLYDIGIILAKEDDEAEDEHV